MTNRSLLYSLFVHVAFGLGIGLLVVGFTQLAHVPLLRDIELLAIDYRYQQRGVLKNVSEQGNVVVVDISDKDLAALTEPYPFPRSYYAHLIENLNRAGARTIVLDRIFSTPGRGDDSLRAVLARSENVVLAAQAPPQEIQGRYLIRSASPDYANIFYGTDKRIGAVRVPLDPDNAVRRYFPFVWSSGYLMPSLAFAALNHAYRLAPDSLVGQDEIAFLFGDREIPKADDDSFLLNFYGPARTFRFVPFSQVIDDPSFWTRDELDIDEQINAFDENLMRVFSNKVVLVGSTLAEERDTHIAPIADSGGDRTMDGVELHATAIQNVIDRSFVRPPGGDLEIVFLLFVSVATFVSLVGIKRLQVPSMMVLEVISVLFVLLLIAGVVQLSVLQFNSQSLLMNVVNPTLAILCAYGGTIVYQLVFWRQQKSLIRNSFSPYLSKEIVDILIAHPATAKLGGDERSVTVLASDIADFSTISEPLPPEKLVLFLQEYREEMTTIVLKHGGTLDTFRGDMMLAFWGAPIAHEDHARRACVAAMEIQARLEQVRPRWQRTGKPAVNVRIGIDTGDVVIGNMGGRARFDYSVIGETVNFARRLETANKDYRSQIILSDSTYGHVRESVIARELDLLLMKGRTEPVKIWELLTTIDAPLDTLRQQALDSYHLGLQQFRERQWNDAIRSLQEAKALDPTCFATDVYEQRASYYKLNPPGPDWNGVFTRNTP